MTKNQQDQAEPHVSLTGSEFHRRKRKIIPASWITLTLAVSVYPHLWLNHTGRIRDAVTATAEIADVRNPGGQRTHSLTAACMQNF